MPYSAAQLYSYEVFKKVFQDKDGKLSVQRRLAAGACAGMAATLVRAMCLAWCMYLGCASGPSSMGAHTFLPSSSSSCVPLGMSTRERLGVSLALAKCCL